MENVLNKLLKCDLYQVSKEKGYINIRSIRDEYSLTVGLDDMHSVEKIGTVIVKRNTSILPRQKLREILTRTPIDAIYERRDDLDGHYAIAYSFSKELDTFILVTGQRPTVEDIEQYVKDHEDVKSFKRELEDLINDGAYYHSEIKQSKKTKVYDDNARAKKLLEKARKAR